MPENKDKKLLHYMTMLKHELEMRGASGTHDHRETCHIINDIQTRLDNEGEDGSNDSDTEA